MKRIAFIVLLALFSVSCDDMQVVDIMSDLSGAPYGMVLIPGGEATIGAPEQDALGVISEINFTRGKMKRERLLTFDAFYMDATEVTVGDFIEFIDATGWEGPGQGWQGPRRDSDKPVYASYNAAIAYAEWAGKRLPTSEEWEYAARGGLVGKMYPWGDQLPNDDLCRFQGDYYRTHQVKYPVPVASYPPNGYGLFDMAGNLAEWVLDEPELPNGINHGGDWLSGSKSSCRVYFRAFYPRDSHNGLLGFRCIKGITDLD